MVKKKMGRPALTIDVAQVEKLASRWMTKDAIADFLSISRATFYNKMNADPAIEEAWLKGRASLQAKSMDWLIASAQNGSVKAQTFLAERICGLSSRVMHEGEVTTTTRWVVEIPAEEPNMESWLKKYGNNGYSQSGVQ